MRGSARGKGRLLFVLPSVGLFSVGVVLLLGLPKRPILYAEVYGGPTDSELSHYNARVHVIEEQHGIERDMRGLPLTVSWEGETNQRAISAVTDEEGWVEVRLQRPLDARGVRLSVRERETERILARGEPSLPRERWAASAGRRGGKLAGKSEGPILVEARVEEAVFAVPFVGHIHLSLALARGRLSGTSVEARVEGAELLSSASWVVEGPEPTRISLRPLEHVSSLHLKFRTPDGESGSYYASLPIVPGAFYVSREESHVQIASPLPRAGVWYAFVSELGRDVGGFLPLRSDERGGSVGRLPKERWPVSESPRFLVLASSPDGRSPSTVGFPLDGQSGSFDALDGRLLDGAAPARQEEERRRSKLRGLLFVHLGFVFALTIVLFLLRVRTADQELAARLEKAGAGALVPRRFLATIGLAAFCVVLGLSLTLIWVALSGAFL